jgi:hypothetical protein
MQFHAHGLWIWILVAQLAPPILGNLLPSIRPWQTLQIPLQTQFARTAGQPDALQTGLQGLAIKGRGGSFVVSYYLGLGLVQFQQHQRRGGGRVRCRCCHCRARRRRRTRRIIIGLLQETGSSSRRHGRRHGSISISIGLDSVFSCCV